MEGQYKAPPVPYDGIGTRIELPPPPQSLVEVALRNYFDSEEHAVWLDKVVQRESRRKNPPTREQIDVETRLAEREFMKLWGHLIERYPPTLFLIEEEIDRALDPIFSLLEQAVCPFLKHQLGIESFDVLV